MTVSSFYNSFPKIQYDINNKAGYQSGPHDAVTNIFFRLGIVKNVIENMYSYFVYDIKKVTHQRF